jgi:hypothetical protein
MPATRRRVRHHRPAGAPACIARALAGPARSVARAGLAIALAAIVVGSCGAPPPGPIATAVSRTSSPTAALITSEPDRTVPPTAGAGTAGFPRMLIRSASPAGATWWVTERGQPDRWTPLQLPIRDGDPGPAAPDGRVLMAGGGRIIVGRIDGSALQPISSQPMPVGRALLPACFAGDGRVVLADAETLELIEPVDGGIEPYADVAQVRGACAPLDDGWTLVALDGGGLVAIRAGSLPVPVRDALGRHLSGGGGRIALTDPSTEQGAAVIRRATVSEDGRLGAEIGRVMGRGAERVIDAQLSPDGGWLAVTLEGAADTVPGARLRLYGVTGDGLTQVAELELAVGTRVTLLPGD